MLGRLWEFSTTGPIFASVWIAECSWGRRANLQSLAPEGSLQPLKMMVFYGIYTVTDVLIKITLQLWSHSLPIPIKLWWKCGIIWPTLVRRVGRSISHDDNDLCAGPPSVPMIICMADVFTLAQGTLGVK